MNNRYSKKIRKEINSKMIADYEELIRTLQTERWFWRIVIALRIVFNWNPEKVKFRIKTEK